MVDRYILADTMKTRDGKPAPIGRIVHFTRIDLHQGDDDRYTSVGHLVRTPQKSDMVVEYLRFKHALGEVYRSPDIMETIRRDDSRELSLRKQSREGLASIDLDPSKKIFLYCKTGRTAVLLGRFFARLGERVNFQGHEYVQKGQLFMEARSPTIYQNDLFAGCLEDELNRK